MKYVGPKAELLLLSADPIMDSFKVDNMLDLWDMLNGQKPSPPLLRRGIFIKHKNFPQKFKKCLTNPKSFDILCKHLTEGHTAGGRKSQCPLEKSEKISKII